MKTSRRGTPSLDRDRSWQAPDDKSASSSLLTQARHRVLVAKAIPFFFWVSYRPQHLGIVREKISRPREREISRKRRREENQSMSTSVRPALPLRPSAVVAGNHCALPSPSVPCSCPLSARCPRCCAANVADARDAVAATVADPALSRTRGLVVIVGQSATMFASR